MPLTFVTVLRSGGIYRPAWVHRLNRQAARHLNPTRIVCLTDYVQTPRCHDGVEFLPLVHHEWSGWFAKLELFRPHLFHEDDACLYVDLDSLIVAPIPNLERTIHEKRRLLMLDDFYSPKLPASGVMAWTPSGATENVYFSFLSRPVMRPGWRHGDGIVIGNHPHGRLQPLFPGAFGSFKKDQLHAGPKRFSVCCFHGLPKNNDFAIDHWVTKAWLDGED